MAGGPGSLSGRVALVTGAGRGLGRAHAAELARRGAAVVVNDTGVALDGADPDPAVATAAAAEIRAAGGRAVADHCDVRGFAGAQSAVDRAVAEFGGIDIVVNNAGTLHGAGHHDAVGIGRAIANSSAWSTSSSVGSETCPLTSLINAPAPYPNTTFGAIATTPE